MKLLLPVLALVLLVPQGQTPIVQFESGRFTTIELDRVEGRGAIRTLMKATQKSYAIDPDVTGVVTLVAHNVALDVALTVIADQLNAKLDIQGDVYRFSRKRLADRIRVGSDITVGTVIEPAAMTVDNRFLYLIKGGELWKYDKQNYRVLDRVQLQSTYLTQGDVRAVLESLLGAPGVDYQIDPAVTGQVKVAPSLPFATALQAILRQVDADYTVSNGTYKVSRKNTAPPVH